VKDGEVFCGGWRIWCECGDPWGTMLRVVKLFIELDLKASQQAVSFWTQMTLGASVYNNNAIYCIYCIIAVQYAKTYIIIIQYALSYIAII
jgi:hypothetical protein